MIQRLPSVQLWRLLKSQIPLRHPYTRLLQQEYIHHPRQKQRWGWMWFLIIAILLAWLITSPEVFGNGLLWLVGGLIIWLFMGGNIGGVFLSIHTIAIVHAERKKHRKELIALTPLGYIGMMVSIFYVALKRPRWIRDTIFGILDFALFISIYYLIISLVIVLLFGSATLFYSALLFLGFVFSLRLDTIQSIVLGGLTSIFITQSTVSDRTSTQFLAIGFIGLIQAVIYGLLMLILWLSSWLHVDKNPLYLTIYWAVSLAILLSVREFLIYGLFHMIKRHYGENEANLAMLYNNL